MRTIIAATIFRIVQIIMLPIAALGYVVFVVRLVIYSVRTGSAATVLASLYTRYMQHQLGTRRDEPAARLMQVMPNVPQLALRAVVSPTLLAHRLTGYVPRIYRYPYPGQPSMQHQPSARTTFYDTALEQHLPQIEQLVILGAGFDTRAYRLPPGARQRVRAFEIDAPKTQAFKREMLRKAGIDTSRVTYVPADFEHEDWLARLIEAGFQPDKPSFFTWESVTMYLDRAAVESTLRKIATTAKGSAIAFDYFSTAQIEDRSLFMRYARAVIKITGESWHFGIDTTPPARQRVAAFVQACGLTLEQHRIFGQESERKHARAGFATAIVERPAQL